MADGTQRKARGTLWAFPWDLPGNTAVSGRCESCGLSLSHPAGRCDIPREYPLSLLCPIGRGKKQSRGYLHGVGCHNQRATALFLLHFLAVFSSFFSILIPFLTSCGSYLPCVPHLPVAFYVVKSKASPEQFRQGFAVFSVSRFFLSVSNAKTAPKPPHAVGCYNQR